MRKKFSKGEEILAGGGNSYSTELPMRTGPEILQGPRIRVARSRLLGESQNSFTFQNR